MPGAWLQTPANTRLIAHAILQHAVEARAHGPVLAHAVAHRVDVDVPRLAEQRGVVHEDLAVHAHDVQQADVAALEGRALLAVSSYSSSSAVAVGVEALAHAGVAVQLIQQLLHVVEAHRHAHLPSVGTRCVPCATQTFFVSM